MVDGGTVRIAWEVLETGETGVTEPIETCDIDVWLGWLDDKYGFKVHHWIVVDETVED